MSKRFTATEKWDDPWFSALDANHKLAWLYLLDKCNHAGIYNVNAPLIIFQIGLLPEPKAFGGRVVIISQEKWFIPKFVEFQYGQLEDANRAHASVISILKKEGAYKHLKRSLQGRKDKDKDKDKESFFKEGGVGETKQLTPLQQIVRGWKIQTGNDPEDAAWDKVHFSANAGHAKKLLDLFEGDVGAVLDCIEDRWAQIVTKQGLSLSLAGVVKNSDVFRQRWLEAKERKGAA